MSDPKNLALTLDVLEHNWTRLENADYSDEELEIALEDAIECVKTVIDEWGIQL